MSATRKIWIRVTDGSLMPERPSDADEHDNLYHHDDVVRELVEALTKIADTNVWGQSMHHALNTRIRIATDALAKIAQEDQQ